MDHRDKPILFHMGRDAGTNTFLSHFNFTEKLKLLIFRVFRFRFRREIPDSGLEIRVQTTSGYFEENCG